MKFVIKLIFTGLLMGAISLPVFADRGIKNVSRRVIVINPSTDKSYKALSPGQETMITETEYNSSSVQLEISRGNLRLTEDPGNVRTSQAKFEALRTRIHKESTN